ncbi:Rrf2 family transcriptional regulator [Arthrobacter sp. JSM 101049]|uniref:RrF2 family transcriptional regulator n=1 Tax=Arthrobacter sp. JSM 101049 TaxID=929097 RepID=UPI003566C0EF
MRINAFPDVCLRILMLLAARPEQQLTSRDIAAAIGIPYNQVSKAVLRLGQLGHVDVQRGRTGGVRISTAGLDARPGSILRSLDEQPDVVDCTREDGTSCPLIAGCRLRTAFGRAREAFYGELDATTIRELAASPTLARLPLPRIP